jgi:hypothetical protein
LAHGDDRWRALEDWMSENSEKFGYTLDELAEKGPIGKTKLYEAIADGRLTARKEGRRTIVLGGDYLEYLRSLPKVQPKVQPKP